MIDVELLEGEVFVDVRCSSGRFKISNKGRCWNVVKKKFMIPHNNGAGYYAYSLGTMQYAHRLVAQHFIPNPENKAYVNHIDHDRSNNCVENLEWVTAKENTAHGIKAGRINNKLRGKTNQLTEEQRVEAVLLRRIGCGITEIANMFNMSRTTLSSVFNGRSNPDLVELVESEIEGLSDERLIFSINCAKLYTI